MSVDALSLLRELDDVLDSIAGNDPTETLELDEKRDAQSSRTSNSTTHNIYLVGIGSQFADSSGV